jgi:hypothetical protein
MGLLFFPFNIVASNKHRKDLTINDIFSSFCGASLM